MNLRKAIENGFSDRAHFVGDTDLESLKTDARYNEILAQLR